MVSDGSLTFFSSGQGSHCPCPPLNKPDPRHNNGRTCSYVTFVTHACHAAVIVPKCMEKAAVASWLELHPCLESFSPDETVLGSRDIGDHYCVFAYIPVPSQQSSGGSVIRSTFTVLVSNPLSPHRCRAQHHTIPGILRSKSAAGYA